jgi:hypothetical protein
VKITKTLLKQIIKEEYDKESKKQATWITDEYGIATWTYKEWTLKKYKSDEIPFVTGPKGTEVGIGPEGLSVIGEGEGDGYVHGLAEVVEIPIIVLKELMKYV